MNQMMDGKGVEEEKVICSTGEWMTRWLNLHTVGRLDSIFDRLTPSTAALTLSGWHSADEKKHI